MPAAEHLSPTEVRGRLFDALAPLVQGVERTSGADVAARLKVYVRPFPLEGESPGTRIILLIENETSETVLSTGLAASMPNQTALTAAVNDVLAVALASLGEEAEDAVALAERRAAVLLLETKPAAATVRVLLVPKNGRPLVIGALVDAPARAH